jgi:hypothetical protein
MHADFSCLVFCLLEGCSFLYTGTDVSEETYAFVKGRREFNLKKEAAVFAEYYTATNHRIYII